VQAHSDAVTAYDRALALRPDLAEAWLGRGYVHTELKQHNEALAAYEQALALRPDLAEAWLGRGNVHVELKQHNDALAAYDRALALRPDLAEAWLGRGSTFFERAQYDEALFAYERAVALKDDFAKPWFRCGMVFVELNQYDRARAAFDRALALDSDLEHAMAITCSQSYSQAIGQAWAWRSLNLSRQSVRDNAQYCPSSSSRYRRQQPISCNAPKLSWRISSAFRRSGAGRFTRMTASASIISPLISATTPAHNWWWAYSNIMINRVLRLRRSLMVQTTARTCATG